MKTLIAVLFLLALGACASRQPKPVVAAPTPTVKKVEAAYGGNCGMGLCHKKMVKGDEKYSTDYKGQHYIFSSQEAKDKFMKNIDANIALANKAWESALADKLK